MSQHVSGMESIFGALSRFEDFLMNPLLQSHSGTASEQSRNAYGTNQGTNDDDSQSDPHSEASISQSQTNSGPEDGHDSYILFPKTMRGANILSLVNFENIIHFRKMYTHKFYDITIMIKIKASVHSKHT